MNEYEGANHGPVKMTRARRLVIVAALLLSVTIAMVGGMTVWALRSQAIQQWRDEAENLSTVLAEHAGQTVNSAYLVVDSIVERVEAEGVYDSASLRARIANKAFHQMLSDKVGSLPQIEVAAIIGDDGSVIASSRAFPAPSINVADRDYFQSQKNSAGAGILVSSAVTNRGDGKRTFYLSRRLDGPGHEFLGIVAVGISCDFYADFYKKVSLGQGSQLSLLRDDLVPLARYPGDDAWGTGATSGAVHRIVAEQGRAAGSLLLADPARSGALNRGIRVVAARQVPGYPLVVGIGVAEELLLAAWRQIGLSVGMVVLCSILALGFATSVLLQALRRRETDMALAEQLRRDAAAASKELILAASVFDTTAEAIAVTDGEGRILSVNPAFSEITGYSPAEVIGRNPRFLKSGRHDEAFYTALWRDLAAKKHWQGEIWNRRKDGELFLAWQTITAVADPDGKVVSYVAVSNDITEIRRKDDHIRHQAYHDALTGLPNRALVQDRLEHSLDVARRNRSPLVVMFLDLDRFKVIIDTLGHEVGDVLLRVVAERLQGCLRRSDTVARLGGDEFVIVLPDSDSAERAAGLAEKIIARINQPVLLTDHEVRVGVSIGIAAFPGDGDDVATLMRLADTAMYQAKSAGRNCFRFCDPTMNSQALERLTLEGALRRAIDNKEFQLHYQPKVSLKTAQMAGVEALIRWNRPDRGMVPPALFIPLAEETGLIAPIGDWCLDEAGRQLAEWRGKGVPVASVAVNVSARQFNDPSFADKLAALLDRYGIVGNDLEVEMTESTVIADPENAIAQIQRLRDMGIKISVDDFGTGYSSLGYVKRLPLDVVKIDRIFVNSLDADPENAALVAAIISLGHALKLSIVAEGVETEREAAHLAAAGCDLAQGYFYSRPVSADQLEAWARQRDAQAIELCAGE